MVLQKFKVDMLLKNKVAVITGSNRGIGLEILRTFVSNGARIYACARKESSDFLQTIDELSSESGNKIIPIFFDLENTLEIREAVRLINKTGTKPNILINNAGVATGSLFQMTTERQLHDELKTNFISQILFTQGIVKMMMRNKEGSIINIASVSGIVGAPGTLSYGATKAAVIHSTKTISNEVGRYNIRVNSIAPGPVVTDMLDNMDDDAKDKMVESSALKRLGKPSDVANLALFLASDLSSYITGQTIRVDGGMLQ